MPPDSSASALAATIPALKAFADILSLFPAPPRSSCMSLTSQGPDRQLYAPSRLRKISEIWSNRKKRVAGHKGTRPCRIREATGIQGISGKRPSFLWLLGLLEQSSLCARFCRCSCLVDELSRLSILSAVVLVAADRIDSWRGRRAVADVLTASREHGPNESHA